MNAPFDMRAALIINPASRKNLGNPERSARLEAVLGSGGFAIRTQDPASVLAAVETLLNRDCEVFFSDGGDGAYHYLLNALYLLRPENPPLSAPLAGGTVNGIWSCTRTPASAAAALNAALALPQADIAPLASLRAELEFADGRVLSRLCFSAVLGGLGANFFDRYYARSRRGALGALAIASGGVLSALGLRGDGGAELRSLLTPGRFRVTLDEREMSLSEFQLLNAGALYFRIGGLFRVFPLARPGRPQFQAGALSASELLANLPNVALGRALSGAQLFDGVGATMSVRAERGAVFSPMLDGEYYPDVIRATVTAGPPIPTPDFSSASAPR